MSQSLEISTEYWAVCCGGLIAMFACVQFGEAIYSFIPLHRKTHDLANQIYMLSLQQLILTVAAFLIGALGLLFWKMERVSRGALLAYMILSLIVTVYSGFMIARMQITIDRNQNPVTPDEFEFIERCKMLKIANIAMFAILFAYTFFLWWQSRFSRS